MCGITYAGAIVLFDLVVAECVANVVLAVAPAVYGDSISVKVFPSSDS